MASLLWSKWVAPLLRADTYARGAGLQERADLLRLFLLSHAHRTWPCIDDALAKAEEAAPSYSEQHEVVKDHVQQQTLSLLEAWRVARPSPLPPQSRTAPLDEARRAAVEAKWQAARVEAQHRAFGHSIAVGPSTSGAGSGRGVFISGRAPPGSVLALYTGITYQPVDLLTMSGGFKRFDNNVFLMARHDRIIVDGSELGRKLLPSGNRPTAPSQPRVPPTAHRHRTVGKAP